MVLEAHPIREVLATTPKVCNMRVQNAAQRVIKQVEAAGKDGFAVPLDAGDREIGCYLRSLRALETRGFLYSQVVDKVKRWFRKEGVSWIP